MTRLLNLFMVALFSTSALMASTTTNDPLADYLALEIERLELEQELFGIAENHEDPLSIAAIAVYEVDEDDELNFNTGDFLPAGFNAKEGMNELDWNSIKLFKPEEDLDSEMNTEVNSINLSSF